VQQQDGFVNHRESKRNAVGFSINIRLQPGAKAEQDRSRFNGFPTGKKLLKQFVVSAAAIPGLRPVLMGCSRLISQNP
jgi:hypothetical protein